MNTSLQTSQAWLARAEQKIPGGVNSPVRAFTGVGGTPVFIERATGAELIDVAGRHYVDYVGSWGPMIAGHAHPHVIQAVQQAASRGLSYGAPTPGEVSMAERLCELIPMLEQVRLVNSGTEATMSALRLARGATGRDKIIKFAGCYHGHADSFLVNAGSGALTLGVPSSPGVPAALADLTITLPYNDSEAVRSLMQDMGDEIAAIIVEPVAGNMNCIPPLPGFLESLRECCDEHGSILIFDEVMTGFRIALGGAQQVFGVTADLVTYGKVIGGGMPLGAFGGKHALMQQIAPAGPIYQAGTLSGNPIAVAAGMANLDLITVDGFYPQLAIGTAALVNGLQQAARAQGVALATVHIGGMFGVFFSDLDKVTTFEQVMACQLDVFKQFFHGMLERGHYFAPSAYEAGFVSAAHTPAVIQSTVDAARATFAAISTA